MSVTKVLFAGIGGVGGFFGGMMAHHYEQNSSVAVNFIARGEHLSKIKNQGLQVINGKSTTTARPQLATDTPEEVGIVDYIFICTKTYDLKSMAMLLAPCIAPHTVIISLLNGTNNKKTLQHLYPHNLIADGCVYIVSRLKEAGTVENLGNIQSLYFGLDNEENTQLFTLEKLLKAANIEATYSKAISSIIWEKFIFLSPIATATTMYNESIGALLAHKEKLASLVQLMEEVKQISADKGVSLPNDITEKTLTKLKSLPYEANPSMHSDFKQQRAKNELEALTTYVIRQGERHGIKTPGYAQALKAIINHADYNQ